MRSRTYRPIETFGARGGSFLIDRGVSRPVTRTEWVADGEAVDVAVSDREVFAVGDVVRIGEGGSTGEGGGNAAEDGSVGDGGSTGEDGWAPVGVTIGAAAATATLGDHLVGRG